MFVSTITYDKRVMREAPFCPFYPTQTNQSQDIADFGMAKFNAVCNCILEQKTVGDALTIFIVLTAFALSLAICINYPLAEAVRIYHVATNK